MRTISPMITNAITPMSMGIFDSSSSEPFSGTMVAMMASTSSTTGSHATTMSKPLPPGTRNTRGACGSTRRSLRKAGNMGM